MKTISSKISEKEFIAFSQYAKEDSVTVSKLIRKLLCEKVDVEKYSSPLRHAHPTCSTIPHLHNHH